jgi:formylglycine-generating enzyme required for sulfatase activity
MIVSDRTILKDMKTRTALALLLSTFALAVTTARAAPAVISYAGHVKVDGQPFTGQGKFKFAFVNGSGQLSYWSNDGASSAGSAPGAHVVVAVAAGNYSVLLGDTSLSGMGAIDAAVFQNHNDVHLRVWFDDGSNGFQLLTPDRRFASVPYVIGNNGTGTANMADSSGDANGTADLDNPNYNFGGPLGEGFARLVANGPDQPSDTLILLEGDSAQIVTYFADQPGRLQYAFGEHTFAMPKSDELIPTQNTLVGAGSVRLSAPTGSKNLAVLKVSRASGRNPNEVQGIPAPGSTAPAVAPAIVSVPQTRSVARGGTTTLFVSATGDSLTYQWKKNGQNIAGATAAGLPLQNATSADAGQYSVVVTNSDGVATSQAITVTVVMPVVPAGVYRINNSNGNAGHDVALTSFSIDQHEVTKAFWDEVYAWAVANGYDFSNPGIAEGPEHPVHSVNWYDTVKWANALSERDGHVPCYYTDNNCTQLYRSGEVNLTNYNVKWNANGYRLPTETEWEVAARGGLVGSKYAWGESPSTTKANFDQSLHGATLPVGSYPATGYGLYEIGGNLREWVWDWTETYAYDFNESFPDENGSLKLVDDANSTAFHVPEVKGFQPFFGDAQSAAQVQTINSSDSSNWKVKKTIDFGRAMPVFEVRNEISMEHHDNSSWPISCKIKFFYSDGNTAESSVHSQDQHAWIAKTYANPNPQKLVHKVEVWLKHSYTGNSDYEAKERNTRVYRYASNTNVGYLTLNMPPYYQENNATHFRVNVDATREVGDDIWFELVDGNASKTYANADFDQLLPVTAPIYRPKKLRIYLNQSPSSSTIGGTFVHAVYWGTDNPKSHWTGTQRVMRDNHYAEGLVPLGTRNYSDPKNRYSTVGFRLVQRP